MSQLSDIAFACDIACSQFSKEKQFTQPQWPRHEQKQMLKASD